MTIQQFNLDSGLAVLERTPATFRALLSGLGGEWTDATEGPDTWSPYIVVGHLIYSDRAAWVPRARMILDEGPERAFIPLDRFAQLRESEGKSLGQLLDEFDAVRASNVETVRSWRIGEAELTREGLHPDFGRVTLRQLLSTWVAHDLGHIAQATRVMAKQYREAVGPWEAFLPVLRR